MSPRWRILSFLFGCVHLIATPAGPSEVDHVSVTAEITSTSEVQGRETIQVAVEVTGVPKKLQERLLVQIYTCEQDCDALCNQSTSQPVEKGGWEGAVGIGARTRHVMVEAVLLPVVSSHAPRLGTDCVPIERVQNAEVD